MFSCHHQTLLDAEIPVAKVLHMEFAEGYYMVVWKEAEANE